MALIKCPECGNEVSENAANCPNCGNPIAQKEQRPQQPRPLPPPTPQQAPKKMCKHCKAEIPKTAKVCPNCNKKQGGVIKWVIIAVISHSMPTILLLLHHKRLQCLIVYRQVILYGSRLKR